MKGLLRNNFYSMQDSIKLSVLVIVCVVALALFAVNTVSIMVIAAGIIMFPLNIGSSLQADEVSKWNKFEVTLPVSRKTIVQCKYISYLMLVLMGLVSSLAILLLFTVTGNEIAPETVLISYLFGLTLAMFTGSLMYPLLLTLGAQRSELIIVISAMGAGGITIGSWFLLGQLIQRPKALATFVVPLALSVLCFALSYLVSVAIHAKKEF